MQNALGRTPKSIFPPPQQQALSSWNGILTSLNLSSAENNFLSPQLIADNRLAAFQLFRAGHSQSALTDLAGAFKSQMGHWVNGEPPGQAIPLIINHMNARLLKSTCNFEYYRSGKAWQGKK